MSGVCFLWCMQSLFRTVIFALFLSPFLSSPFSYCLLLFLYACTVYTWIHTLNISIHFHSAKQIIGLRHSYPLFFYIYFFFLGVVPFFNRQTLIYNAGMRCGTRISRRWSHAVEWLFIYCFRGSDTGTRMRATIQLLYYYYYYCY